MLTVGLAQVSEFQVASIGMNAYQEGKSIEDCPFEGEARRHWVSGFNRQQAFETSKDSEPDEEHNRP